MTRLHTTPNLLFLFFLLFTATLPGTSPETPRTLLERATQERETARYDQALAHARKAAQLARDFHDNASLGEALNLTGSIFWDRREYQQACDYYQQALMIRQKLGSRNDTAITLANLGATLSELGRTNEALDHYGQALALRRTLADSTSVAFLYSKIGSLFLQIGDYVPALDYYMRALRLRETIGNPRETAASLNNIGLVFKALNESESALDYHQRARDIYAGLHAEREIAQTDTYIGNVHWAQKDYSTALAAYKKAYERRHKHGTPAEQAASCSNIGLAYREMNQDRQALEWLERARVLWERQANRQGIATVLNYIAKIHARQGDRSSAEHDYRQAMDYYRAVGDLDGVVRTRLNLIQFFVGNRNYERALTEWRHCTEENARLHAPDLRQEELSVMAELYRTRARQAQSLRDWMHATVWSDSAFYFRDAYDSLRFSQLDQEKQQRISRLMWLYESEHQLQENARLREKYLVQGERLRRQRWMALAYAAIAIIFLGFALVIFRLYRHKAKVNRALSSAYAEIDQTRVQLELAARTDPLTGLANRREMLERIDQEIVRFERNEKPFVVAICDIDHFKRTNDTYGHDAGDVVLKQVAEIMSNTIRKQDVLARWGGEEFLFLLPETNLEGGRIITERIREQIAAATFPYGGLSIPVSITIGVNAFDHMQSVDECIKSADIALYHGKENGRNRVVTAAEIPALQRSEIL